MKIHFFGGLDHVPYLNVAAVADFFMYDENYLVSLALSELERSCIIHE